MRRATLLSNSGIVLPGKVHWLRTWDRVLDRQPPTFRWFVGGRTNLAYNCLDRHVEQGRA